MPIVSDTRGSTHTLARPGRVLLLAALALGAGLPPAPASARSRRGLWQPCEADRLAEMQTRAARARWVPELALEARLARWPTGSGQALFGSLRWHLDRPPAVELEVPSWRATVARPVALAGTLLDDARPALPAMPPRLTRAGAIVWQAVRAEAEQALLAAAPRCPAQSRAEAVR